MSDKSDKSEFTSPIISKLQDDIKIGKKQVVSKFWKEIEKVGTPIFENIDGDNEFNFITFLYRAEEKVDNIICNSAFVKKDIKEGLLERIDDTNIYFRTYKSLKGLRLIYNLCKNNPLRPKDPLQNFTKYGNLAFTDPLNPKIHNYLRSGLKLSFNEFKSPEAPPQPYYGTRSDISHGKIESFQFNSNILNRDRKILVYLPPNYSIKNPPYHFILLFDGLDFEEHAQVSSTLDNLIADDRIPPVIAIMIENFLAKDISIRWVELPPNPKFLSFIIKELLPWIHKQYNVTSDPSQSVIAGASYGGLASGYIALNHPEIFMNVLSMSGAFSWYPGADVWLQMVKNFEDLEHWWSDEDEREGEWLIHQFSQYEKLNLKFYLDVGIIEKDNPNQIFISNHHFRDILRIKGYPVSYVEFLGGHNFVCWRASIADGLIYLIGKHKK